MDEMSDFEERSGIISQTTDWGSWSQSLKDVTIEVHLENVNFCVDSSDRPSFTSREPEVKM